MCLLYDSSALCLLLVFLNTHLLITIFLYFTQKFLPQYFDWDNHHDYCWAEPLHGVICSEVPTLVQTAIADGQDYSGREQVQGPVPSFLEGSPGAVASAGQMLSGFLCKTIGITGAVTDQSIFVEVRFC